ncbi:hypothetical protein JS528_06490 [Bifidobacterium sp. MA2]|uniref:Uncharacterized protein n=1 Tax=Bifidobacterium santillanense TaxID=2809028 RepID=A0ABS5UQ49_9BIFI|nr:hypothetical protein [Bifidobacterium santillanense]MBT1173009.1 hypothetical protein [Bifidobacterium santillanense]
MDDHRVSSNIPSTQGGHPIRAIRQRYDPANDPLPDAPILHPKARLTVKAMLFVVGNVLFWSAAFAPTRIDRMVGWSTGAAADIAMLLGVALTCLAVTMRPHPIGDRIGDALIPIVNRKLSYGTRRAGRRIVVGVVAAGWLAFAASLVRASGESSTSWFADPALIAFLVFLIVAGFTNAFVFNDRR